MHHSHYFVLKIFYFFLEKKKSKGKNVFIKASENISQATYLPDFVNLKQGWIIECKGLRTEAFNLRWKIFKNRLVKEKKIYENMLVKQKDKTNTIILYTSPYPTFYPNNNKYY